MAAPAPAKFPNRLHCALDPRPFGTAEVGLNFNDKRHGLRKVQPLRPDGGRETGEKRPFNDDVKLTGNLASRISNSASSESIGGRKDLFEKLAYKNFPFIADCSTWQHFCSSMMRHQHCSNSREPFLKLKIHR